MKYITLLLALLWVLKVSAASTIAGIYATKPFEASEPLFLTQPLTTLISDPLEIQKISITGRTQMLKISETQKGFKMTALDSKGESLFELETQSERNEKDGAVSYRIYQEWKSGDEWGSSRGTTTTWLKKEADGSLNVSLDMTGQRKIFFFWGKLRSTSCWMKYESKEPNQPLQRNASTAPVSNLKSPARRG